MVMLNRQLHICFVEYCGPWDLLIVKTMDVA